MIFDRRVLIFLATNFLLLQLMLLVNSGITFAAINLFILGPACIFPALYLRADHFFVTAIITGLWIDAALPSLFGIMTVLIPTIGTLILLTRRRFRAEKNFHPCLLAHLANFTLVLAIIYTLILEGASSYNLVIIQSIELALSHLILLFVAPWFFNLQRLLFRISDSKTEPESLPFI